MATPTLTTRELPGALGGIIVDVRASARTASRPAVLILHGFKGHKDHAFLPSVAERMARAGFMAVTATISGAGVDGAGNFTRADLFRRNTYSAELDDLATVLAAVRAGELDVAPPSSVGLLGFSRGGGIAVLLADRDPGVKALATWSAIARTRRWTEAEAADWRRAGTVEIPNSATDRALTLGTELLADTEARSAELDITAAASRLAIPWLLVHPVNDETVPLAEGRALAAAARSSARTFWVGGADHHFGARGPRPGMTDALQQVLDRTVSHFSQHLS